MTRKTIGYLALEGVVVLFGVLAALLVEGARENAGRQQAAEASAERVFREVSLNAAELRDMQTVVTERLEKLRELQDEEPQGVALSALVQRFVGYRTPELSSAAWKRLSGSDLADWIDAEMLEEAFYLYERVEAFEDLDREINRLVFGELFSDPTATSTAIAISELIMEQQLGWAGDLIPRHEQFLARSR
ncbi:MAG: hypothetical protein ABFS14_02210 [Gemmatimonadota bacterium]